jgi:hypothetical protein
MTYHQFIQRQIEEIKRHKWIESEKAGYDLGEVAVVQWVEQYAEPFHRHLVDDLGEQVGPVRANRLAGCASRPAKRH